MKKLRIVLLGMGLLGSGVLISMKAENPPVNDNTEKAATRVAEEIKVVQDTRFIDSVYQLIQFDQAERPLSKKVFEKAYTGYLNLQANGWLSGQKQLLTIADFSLSANKKRLWVIDLATHEVLFHTLVAHGQGTGQEFARQFSNRPNSHESSIGFYVTRQTYSGRNGYSLKLNGMDEGYNDNAYDRAIVMHGADYVSRRFIAAHQRLGRSWGCPAVPVALAKPIINTIKDSTCLYIYYPDTTYLASSKWLKSPYRNHPFGEDADTTGNPTLLADQTGGLAPSETAQRGTL